MENTLTPELLLAGIQEARLVAIVRGTDGGGRREGSPRGDGGGLPVRRNRAHHARARWKRSARSARPPRRAASSAPEPC